MLTIETTLTRIITWRCAIIVLFAPLEWSLLFFPIALAAGVFELIEQKARSAGNRSEPGASQSTTKEM